MADFVAAHPYLFRLGIGLVSGGQSEVGRALYNNIPGSPETKSDAPAEGGGGKAVPDSDDDYLENLKKAKKKPFKLSSEGKAIQEAAEKLGISALDLATIIGYETSGTFNPKIRGGKGGKYRGLIQFGEEEYKKYHVAENDTIEKQLLNSVVPFLQDRFASVGRSTAGASRLDIYKAINGGNPNFSSNASDGFHMVNGVKVRNTIADHVERMSGAMQQAALNKFWGGDVKNLKDSDANGQNNVLKDFLNDKLKANQDALNKLLEEFKNTVSTATNKDDISKIFEGYSQTINEKLGAVKALENQISSVDGKSGAARENLLQSQKDREEKTAKEMSDAVTEAGGKQVDIAQNTAQRTLEIESSQATTRGKILDELLAKKLIGEKDYAVEIGNLNLEKLESERKYLNEILASGLANEDQQKDIQQRLVLLDEETTQTKLDNSAMIREVLEREKQIQKEIAADLLTAKQELQNFQKDKERGQKVDNVNHSFGKERIVALNDLKDFDLKENDRRRDAAITQAKLESKLFLDGIKDLETRKAVEKDINDLLQARIDLINGQHDETETGIVQNNKQDTDDAEKHASFGGAIKSYFEGLKDDNTIQDASGTLAAFGDLTVDTFDRMKQAIGASIEQWALYGGSIGKALKQALAA